MAHASYTHRTRVHTHAHSQAEILLAREGLLDGHITAMASADAKTAHTLDARQHYARQYRALCGRMISPDRICADISAPVCQTCVRAELAQARAIVECVDGSTHNE